MLQTEAYKSYSIYKCERIIFYNLHSITFFKKKRPTLQ